MPSPPMPQFTGDGEVDLSNVIAYLYNLADYLDQMMSDDGWTTSGIVENKSLVSGDTLLNTQNVLGTLINVLVENSIINP